MAAFPKHETTTWKLSRGPSVVEQVRCQATKRFHEGVEEVRSPKSELWWQGQRHISQVAPADSPDRLGDLDLAKYRYQLYVRPSTEVQNADDIRASQVSTKSAYCMKRVAVDRPYLTVTPECHVHHGHMAPSSTTSCNEIQNSTGNDNGENLKQPMTPVNPFGANPLEEQRRVNCGSDSKASSSSTTTSGSFFNHEEEIKNNNNNNNSSSSSSHNNNNNVGSDCKDNNNRSIPCASRDLCETAPLSKGTCSSKSRNKGTPNSCNVFLPQLATVRFLRDPTMVEGADGRLEPSLKQIACPITPGYGTYKIIGGKQYKEKPEVDPRLNMQLPRHLAEYQEYQRRCPCPRLGRFDRADPDNEMMLPAHKSGTLMKTSPSPFTYLRNPKLHRADVNYAAIQICHRKKMEAKRHGEQLSWELPTFF